MNIRWNRNLFQEEFTGVVVAERKRGPKRVEDIDDPVLKRIFEVMPKWRGRADLCRELRLNLSHFGEQRHRGVPIDVDLLERVCWRSGASLDYLRLGILPKFDAAGQRITSLSETLQHIIQLVQPEPEASQRALLECAKVVASGHSMLVRAMESTAIGLQYVATLGRDTIAENPDDPLQRPDDG